MSTASQEDPPSKRTRSQPKPGATICTATTCTNSDGQKAPPELRNWGWAKAARPARGAAHSSNSETSTRQSSYWSASVELEASTASNIRTNATSPPFRATCPCRTRGIASANDFRKVLNRATPVQSLGKTFEATALLDTSSSLPRMRVQSTLPPAFQLAEGFTFPWPTGSQLLPLTPPPWLPGVLMLAVGLRMHTTVALHMLGAQHCTPPAALGSSGQSP